MGKYTNRDLRNRRRKQKARKMLHKQTKAAKMLLKKS